MSSRPARRSSQAVTYAGLVGFGLTLIPVAAALRLTGHGGGYTIDQWGVWGAVTVVAAGVALISQPVSRLSGVQRLLPLSLLGLALWSMLSAHWAAWPQSALVEGDRDFLRGLAESFLCDCPGWLSDLETGLAEQSPRRD